MVVSGLLLIAGSVNGGGLPAQPLCGWGFGCDVPKVARATGGHLPEPLRGASRLRDNQVRQRHETWATATAKPLPFAEERSLATAAIHGLEASPNEKVTTTGRGDSARDLTSPWEREVIYQIFPRSFCDSNGDRIGDLRGIASKLDYVKELGATAILINPIVKSPMYHNYFATDFKTVDPAYGTNADFFNLVRAAHRKGLKVILDTEYQYVSEGHPWFEAVKQNPAAPEAAFFWDDKFFFTSIPLPLYDGQKVRAKALDPGNPMVRKTVLEGLQTWVAPGGKSTDGVDGFRIDHMTDDFDFQGVKKNMLGSFWLPMEKELKKTKPGLFFIGEQADWAGGGDLFEKGGVDAIYAISLCGSISTRDAAKIAKGIEVEQKMTPAGRTQAVFLENHDLRRFASEVHSDPDWLRLGAVLNLTLKGTPLVYYGQELGMKGKSGNWNSDGNDIPVRLAFRWNATRAAKGTADWYRGTGPWATDQYSSDHDGISLEEQDGDPDSLLNFYRKLIHLRQSHPALREGSQEVVDATHPGVFAFIRQSPHEKVLVAVNLSRTDATLTAGGNEDLWSNEKVKRGAIQIPAKGFRIVRVK